MLDIEPYKQKEEIIRQTAEQVRKDFALVGIDMEFVKNANFVYQDMFDQLTIHIARLLESDWHRLSILLYQIDIPENTIRKTHHEHPGWPLQSVITELVIHRELKKVLFRNYFKNNSEMR